MVIASLLMMYVIWRYVYTHACAYGIGILGFGSVISFLGTDGDMIVQCGNCDFLLLRDDARNDGLEGA